MNGINEFIFSQNDEYQPQPQDKLAQTRCQNFQKINLSPMIRIKLSKIVELTEEDSIQSVRIKNHFTDTI